MSKTGTLGITAKKGMWGVREEWGRRMYAMRGRGILIYRRERGKNNWTGFLVDGVIGQVTNLSAEGMIIDQSVT